MILLTGGTGFVGRRIAAALRARDLPVRCLVRDPARGRALEAAGCELATGDVTDAGSVRRAADGCTAVVHLVAIIQGSAADVDRVMVDGTRHVLAAAGDGGAGRFVLMSALGVSEETKDLVPYYRAKWAMEEMTRAAPLEHVIFRPSFVFGPGGGALRQFTLMARYLPVIPVPGDGSQRIQPIFVDDVAQFFARAVDHPGAAGRLFELGGPEVLTWNELWDRLAATLGKRRSKVHLPTALLRPQAALFERLPKAPVTRDQLTMLEAGDNVCDPRPAVETFGVELTPLDEQLRRSVAA
jgi:NADH dehydrogenase